MDIIAAQPHDPAPPFDLILKDHEPPEVNACRLLRKLEDHPRTRRIPLVAYSSQESKDAVFRCLQAGAADYLIKPLRHVSIVCHWVFFSPLVSPFLSSLALNLAS